MAWYWTINIALLMGALAFLPWALKYKDRIAIAGIALTAIGFGLATFALLEMG